MGYLCGPVQLRRGSILVMLGGRVVGCSQQRPGQLIWLPEFFPGRDGRVPGRPTALTVSAGVLAGEDGRVRAFHRAWLRAVVRHVNQGIAHTGSCARAGRCGAGGHGGGEQRP